MEEKRKIPDFVLNTGSIVSTMRLIIEGAITIFDDEASPLFHLGLAHEREKEAHAFDTIGTGLFELRTQVLNLQELYLKEIGRHQENTMSDE